MREWYTAARMTMQDTAVELAMALLAAVALAAAWARPRVQRRLAPRPGYVSIEYLIGGSILLAILVVGVKAFATSLGGTFTALGKSVGELK